MRLNLNSIYVHTGDYNSAGDDSIVYCLFTDCGMFLSSSPLQPHTSTPILNAYYRPINRKQKSRPFVSQANLCFLLLYTTHFDIITQTHWKNFSDFAVAWRWQNPKSKQNSWKQLTQFKWLRISSSRRVEAANEEFWGFLILISIFIQTDWRLKAKPSNGVFAIAIGYNDTPVEGGNRANR